MTFKTLLEEQKRLFDERWPHDGTPMRVWPYNAGGGNWMHPYSDELKDFLTTAMQKVRESTIEEIQKAIEGRKMIRPEVEYDEGWCDALSDLATHIDQLKEVK